jgi:uncharacterized protein
VIALALAAALAFTAGGPAVPALSGPVVDETGRLSGTEVRRLEGLARAGRAAKDGTGAQLQYLLVNTLDGEAIETYSMRVAEAWKLGTKGRDDGLLVVVALKDRKVRIEVGGGLEGDVTDVQASRIIRNVVAPAFQQGRFGDGLYDAGIQLLSAAGSLPAETARRQAARPTSGSRLGGLGFVALLIGFLVLRAVFSGFTGRRRRSMWGGGPFIGGGWGGEIGRASCRERV